VNRTDDSIGDTFTASVAAEHIHRLAEGPVWDAPRSRVLWVDIERGQVFEGRFEDGTRIVATTRHQFEETVGAVVSSATGALLVAGRDSLVVIDDAGRRPLGPPLMPPGQARRFNDGGCDPAGRFLIGSLALDDEQADRHAEALFRLEFGGAVSTLDDDLGLSNGLAWSPDGTEFYSIDTVPGIVWVRSYDPGTGDYGERRVLLDIDGSPDGMCVDENGNLWIAIWGAGQIRCYTPAGEQLATVRVAAPHTSSVAFIGADLGTLLITTASKELTERQLEEFPDSGRLFLADVGVRGLPTTPWRGDTVN
jgi:sugar lactone lactonase YvrE